MKRSPYSKKSKLYFVASIICLTVFFVFFLGLFLKSAVGKILMKTVHKKFILTTKNIFNWEATPGPYEVQNRLTYTFLDHLPFDQGTLKLYRLYLPK